MKTPAANDASYWPACVHEPGLLTWLARFVTIVNRTSPSTPTPDLVRLARLHGPVPAEWVEATKFLLVAAPTRQSSSLEGETGP